MIVIPTCLKVKQRVSEDEILYEVTRSYLNTLEISGMVKCSYDADARKIYWSLTRKGKDHGY